jgi:hypothetical protein
MWIIACITNGFGGCLSAITYLEPPGLMSDFPCKKVRKMKGAVWGNGLIPKWERQRIKIYLLLLSGFEIFF